MSFKLTEGERRRILAAYPSQAFNVIEEIVRARWPEAPRWIPVTERMPTAEDAREGSICSYDEGCVMWLTESKWVIQKAWSTPPYESIAWLPIPEFKPPSQPVPTPEDPVRVAFEKWVFTVWDDTDRYKDGGAYVSENVRCAWAAWQAAREGAGTPEPVEPSQEDDEAKFRRWLKDNPVLTWQVDEARALWKSIRSAQ